MPYLKLKTNLRVSETKSGLLFRDLSAAVSRITGKPEEAVQASITGRAKMFMAGSEEPTAHVDVKGVEFSEELVEKMTRELCDIINDHLGIPGARVCFTFSSREGTIWGADGRTL